jgi:hypothetical protein
MNLLIALQETPVGAIPMSGYALCFIPLVTVILGFIVAARFTDLQATSTYLRILPKKESEK